MRINEVVFNSGQPLDGYGPGFFRVQGTVYRGPVAMLPDGPRNWAGWPDAAIFLEHRASFDVLLVGTGGEIAPLPHDVRTLFEQARVACEIMGTPAACRTYNVLLGEGRRIAAALMPV